MEFKVFAIKNVFARFNNKIIWKIGFNYFTSDYDIAYILKMDIGDYYKILKKYKAYYDGDGMYFKKEKYALKACDYINSILLLQKLNDENRI